MPHSDYYIDGELIPGVTTVLNVINKPYLQGWRGRWGNKECDAITARATALGTKFHAALYAHTLGLVAPEMEDPEVKQMMAKIAPWIQEKGLILLYREHKVISQQYKYGGTLDGIGTFNGGPLVLIDWKSSKQIDESDYAMQVAAYAQAAKEQENIDIPTGLIVRVDKPYVLKEGEEIQVETLQVRNLDEHFKDFLHALALYNRGRKYKS